MSEVELQFVVQLPNGRRSKPATRSAIQQMFRSGNIPLPAHVICTGKLFNVAIEDFVSDSALLNRLLSGLPESPKAEILKPTTATQSVFVSADASVVDSANRPQSSPVNATVRKEMAFVVKKRRGSIFWWAAPTVGILIVAAAIVVRPFVPWLKADALNLGKHGPAILAAIPQGDESKTAVRKYLKDNLDSGEWEEVRWETPVNVKNQIQMDALYSVRDHMLLVPGEDTHVQMLLNLGVLKQRFDAGQKFFFVRVRFRTTNALGIRTLNDQIYQVFDGEVYPIDPELDVIFKRAWEALIAGENGKIVEVPLTDDEEGVLEYSKKGESFTEHFLNRAIERRKARK